jgi:hypothetical protein
MGQRAQQFWDGVLANITSWLIIVVLCAMGGMLIAVFATALNGLPATQRAEVLGMFSTLAIGLVLSIFLHFRQRWIRITQLGVKIEPGGEGVSWKSKIRSEFRNDGRGCITVRNSRWVPGVPLKTDLVSKTLQTWRDGKWDPSTDGLEEVHVPPGAGFARGSGLTRRTAPPIFSGARIRNNWASSCCWSISGKLKQHSESGA